MSKAKPVTCRKPSVQDVPKLGNFTLVRLSGQPPQFLSVKQDKAFRLIVDASRQMLRIDILHFEDADWVVGDPMKTEKVGEIALEDILRAFGRER